MSEQPPQDPNQPPGGEPPQDPNQGGWGPGGQNDQWQQGQGWGQDPNQPPAGGQGWGAGAGQPPPNYPTYGAEPGFEPPYSPADAIGYGFTKWKDNAGAFIGLALLSIGIGIVINFIGRQAADGAGVINYSSDGFEFSGIAFVFQVISQVVSTLLGAAAVRAAFDAVEGREVSVGAAFQRWNMVQVLVLALVISILTAIGFVLCVLPGIVVTFFTWFAVYFVVQRGESATTAIGSSFTFTTRHIGPMLLLMLLSVLCLIAGTLALVVGLLVAYPTVVIASAYSFTKLQNQPVAP